MEESDIRAHAERARGGDTEALGVLFGAFGADVARLCTRLLGRGADAEDASGETFLRARRAFDDYDPEKPFRGWLLAIAAHHAIDRLRRRATERRIFAPADIDTVDARAPGPSPLRGELDAERRQQVIEAMDVLPDRYRAPLVLRYYAELDYAAIGKSLDLTHAQVGMLLFRARRRMRELLAEPGDVS